MLNLNTALSPENNLEASKIEVAREDISSNWDDVLEKLDAVVKAFKIKKKQKNAGYE